MGELPLYELKIDFEDETGVDFISLVDRPAIEIDWQAFNQVKQKFEVVDTDKRIIAGFAMVANQKIYRNDGSGEYNVFFSADTITQIVQKFFKGKRTDAANIMHTSTLAEGTYVITSFQIDSKRGINTPNGFEPQEDGSWFIEMKVDSDEVWSDVKEGKFKGFSVEGIFEHERKFNIEQMNKNETLIKKLKDVLFGEAEIDPKEVETTEEVVESVEFGESTLADGTPIRWEGELAVGTALYVTTEEGEMAAPDGEHELADGSMLVRTENGLVTEILEAEEVEIEEVMSELMQEMGQALKGINEQLNEIKNENVELKKQLTEFKTEVEKDLKEKSEKIVELGEQEIATPVQKTARSPKWKKKY